MFDGYVEKIKDTESIKQLVHLINNNSTITFIAKEFENYKFIEEARNDKNSLLNYGQKHRIYEQIRNAECPICFEKFKPDSKVTGLACSYTHLYHAECF